MDNTKAYLLDNDMRPVAKEEVLPKASSPKSVSSFLNEDSSATNHHQHLKITEKKQIRIRKYKHEIFMHHCLHQVGALYISGKNLADG